MTGYAEYPLHPPKISSLLVVFPLNMINHRLHTMFEFQPNSHEGVSYGGEDFALSGMANRKVGDH